MTRYKCVVLDGQQVLYFKRYGENEDAVKTELEAFIKERFDRTMEIKEIAPDKTHPVKQEEQVEQKPETEEKVESEV